MKCGVAWNVVALASKAPFGQDILSRLCVVYPSVSNMVQLCVIYTTYHNIKLGQLDVVLPLVETNQCGKLQHMVLAIMKACYKQHSQEAGVSTWVPNTQHTSDSSHAAPILRAAPPSSTPAATGEAGQDMLAAA